jgi:hypothetical protein
LFDLFLELYALLFKFLVASDTFSFEVSFSKNPFAYVVLTTGRVGLNCCGLNFFVVYDALLDKSE